MRRTPPDSERAAAKTPLPKVLRLIVRPFADQFVYAAFDNLAPRALTLRQLSTDSRQLPLEHIEFSLDPLKLHPPQFRANVKLLVHGAFQPGDQLPLRRPLLLRLGHMCAQSLKLRNQCFDKSLELAMARTKRFRGGFPVPVTGVPTRFRSRPTSAAAPCCRRTRKPRPRPRRSGPLGQPLGAVQRLAQSRCKRVRENVFKPLRRVRAQLSQLSAKLGPAVQQ